MDCNYWSCYIHEDERLLIGGSVVLEIETIRYIPDNHNYRQYIKVINIFKHIFEGAALLGIKPISDDVTCLSSLIDAEFEKVSDKNIAHYVQTLFHHFLMKQTQIIFNFSQWNKHFIDHYDGYNMDIYGFSKFKTIFMEKEEINFLLFIKLLPNLRTFIIGDLYVGGADSSIPLSLEFTSNILSCISYFDLSLSSLSFNSFQIIKPSSSINQYIQQNQNKFLNQGWKLKFDTFNEEKRYNIKGEEMLVIQKLKN